LMLMSRVEVAVGLFVFRRISSCQIEGCLSHDWNRSPVEGRP
jgi:hypothetical protein